MHYYCGKKLALAFFENQIGFMSLLPTPELKFFADLSVQVDKPIEVGQTLHGKRRVIPILGGSATGNGWTARVLPGGADFQLIVNERMARVGCALCFRNRCQAT